MYVFMYVCMYVCICIHICIYALSLCPPLVSRTHSLTNHSRNAHTRSDAYAIKVTALERAPEEAAAELLQHLAPDADSERLRGNSPQARASHEAAKSITRGC